MLANFIILQIITPLAAGLLAFVSPRRFSWIIAAIAGGLTLAISLLIFQKILNSQEAIYYHLGGWSATLGIEYKIDKLNSFFMLLISLVSAFNIIAMKDLINHELNPEKFNLFFGNLLIALAGLLGICISNDIFNIYVMLEINAIASYALVASGKREESTKAAFDYLIFGTIGSTMILLGIGFIYSLVGSLNLSIISDTMPSSIDNNAIKAGIFLIIFGILMKAALFPFGSWLAKIYQGAPSFISSMLASSSNKVAIYLLIRFFFQVFKLKEYNFAYLDITLLLFSVYAIFSCSILAYKQTNIKKFLAYSSFSQIGFIVFALAIANKAAISGLLIYCFTHALEKTMLFLAVGYLAIALQSEELDSFAGIRKKYPWLCILIVINLLSNIGVPFTAGFVGKWQLLKASLATDLWCILIILIASIFSFVYAFKLIDLMIFEKTDQQPAEVKQINGKLCLISLTLITMINIYIGVNNQWILDFTNQVSQLLLLK
ncbi:MAG: proton-conducting transporter membrane subunit [Rickettsiales bacterium]